jgi:hypothetical protein
MGKGASSVGLVESERERVQKMGEDLGRAAEDVNSIIFLSF